MSDHEQEEVEDGRAPQQLEVYFPAFPVIDTQALADFVNGCDPEEPDNCEVEAIPADEAPDFGVKITAYRASLGNYTMALLAHSLPTPAPETIEHSRLTEEVRAELLGHEAFVLLSLHGGEEYAPVEGMVFLLKVAMGLCEQGGIGVGNPWTGVCLPAELLSEMQDLMFEEEEEDEETVDDEDDDGSEDAPPGCGECEGGESPGLWASLREDGVPIELLCDFVTLSMSEIAGPDAKGFLFASRGFAQCGFPDLAYRARTLEEMEEVPDLFQALFSYLVANGPVINAGDTMGEDEGVAFRFKDFPEGWQLPFPSWGRLVVEKG